MPEHGFRWTRVAQDTRLAKEPTIFGGLILAADGVGTADVTVHDGQDAGGRQFATFRTPVSRTESHGPPVPAHFDQGLFVAVGSNVEECIVLYKPIPAPASPPREPASE